MNRIEFYNRVDRFKEKLAKEEELKHAGIDRSNDVKKTYSFSKGTYKPNSSFNQKYYNKIDNYYNDGSARYFYSKDEWDAYVKAKEISKKNDSGRDAAIKSSYTNQKQKEADERAEISKKNDAGRDAAIKSSYTNQKQQEQKEADERATLAKKNEESKKADIQKSQDIEKQRRINEENYRKNMEAAQNAEKERQAKIAERSTLSPEYRKVKELEDELAILKQKQKGVVSDGLNNSDNKNKYNELEKQIINKTEELNKAKGNLSTGKTKEESEKEAHTREQERLSKTADYANLSPESKKIAEIEEQITKLKGKMNLAKNKGLNNEDNRKTYESLEKQLENKEKELVKARHELSKKNDSGREAAIKKGYEAEQKRQEDELNSWKKTVNNKAIDDLKEIENKINEIANSRRVSFDINSEYVDLFREVLKEADPDFDGDLTKYLRPNFETELIDPDLDFLNINSKAKELFRDDDHVNLAKKVLESIGKKIKEDIEDTEYEDMQYSNYLEKLKKKKEANRSKTITKDLAEAKLRLSQIYQGNSNGFKMDESLMKVLNEKLQDIDATYDGDIESYVRPYLFGKWIKDDVSYNNVKKALDEIEKELKAADKNNDSYGTYIQKVSKILS